MEKMREIKKRELKVLAAFGVILAVICFIAHKWAFSYAAISRHNRIALGGEMFVVPIILLIALFVWNMFVKPYFEKCYDEVMDAIECFEENPCISYIYDLDKDGNKIGTYRRLYNGKVIYIPCQAKKVEN